MTSHHGLRRGARRLVQRFELPVARRRPLERPDDQLRGRDGPRPRRRADVLRPSLDVRRSWRHRTRVWNVVPMFPAFVVYMICGARRDEPSAVRSRRGRDRAGRGLPHGVLGHQVRDVLPRRVRGDRDRRRRSRVTLFLGGWRGPASGLPAVALAVAVVHPQGHAGHLRVRPGPRHAAAGPLRPADGVRMEGADPVRSRVGPDRPARSSCCPISSTEPRGRC